VIAGNIEDLCLVNDLFYNGTDLLGNIVLPQPIVTNGCKNSVACNSSKSHNEELIKASLRTVPKT